MSDFPASLPTASTPAPDSAPAIRWGIIAPGGIASWFTDTLHRNTAARVVAVGSRSTDRAQAFAGRFGVERAYGSYEQVANDPAVDALYIASPHSEHHVQALLGLSAGKPLLIEKAFCRNVVQTREVIDTARAAGLLVMEAMWTRFLPHIDVLRQLLADGVLGEIVTVQADHGQYFEIGPDHRLLNPELAGGALLDLGIYPVSFASFVLGAPDQVTAVGDLTDTGVDRQVSILLRSGSAQALLSATLAAKTSTMATVAGTQARVEIGGPLGDDFYAPTAFRVVSRTGAVLAGAAGPLTRHLGLAYEAAHFARLLREGATESPLLPLQETLSIMRTLDEVRGQLGVRYPGEGESAAATMARA